MTSPRLQAAADSIETVETYSLRNWNRAMELIKYYRRKLAETEALPATTSWRSAQIRNYKGAIAYCLTLAAAHRRTVRQDRAWRNGVRTSTPTAAE